MLHSARADATTESHTVFNTVGYHRSQPVRAGQHARFNGRGDNASVVEFRPIDRFHTVAEALQRR